MTPPQDMSPVLGPIRRALGEERLVRFIEGHAQVQSQAMFLVMSTMTVPRAGYDEEALAAMKQDADDVRAAADAWATDCEALADAWRAQRPAEGTRGTR